jgi:Tol biopolymer transport system component
MPPSALGIAARALPVVAASIALSFSCGGSPTDDGNETLATIHVTAATNGADPDADGYSVTLDGGQAQSLSANGQVAFGNVALGQHTIALSGVAANCTVSGGLTRSVQNLGVDITVSFTVTCAEILGSIVFSVTTDGQDLDADGYIVSVDGAVKDTVGTTETVTFTGYSAGPHLVVLQDAYVNCATSADQQTVTVVKGGSVPADFAVHCARALLDQIVFIVFDTTRSPKVYQMYAMGTDGSGVRNISNSTSVMDFGADVSPDGTRLVLWRGDLTATQWNIYLMDPDGGILQNLTNDALVQSCAPRWSRYSYSIAYCEGPINGSAEIWTMNPDGTNRVRRTTNTQTDVYPDWYLGGASIVYQKDNGTGFGYDIYSVDLSTGTESPLAANANAFDGTPSYVHTTGGIVYASDRSGNMEVYYKPPGGGAEVNLTNNPAADGTPAVSRDGTKIAFSSDRDGYSAIHVMNFDGSGVTRLTNLRLGPTLLPRWSPPRDH